MADVSFFDPKQEAEVKRRRLLAEQLAAQGQQTGTEVVSGIVVPKSPLEGLAKALTTGVAGYQAGQADRLQAEDAAAKQKLLAQAVGQYGTDPAAAAQMLMQSPATSDVGMQMYMQDIKRKQDLELAQAGYAREDAKWEKDAALKRELKGMSAGGSFEADENGNMVYVPPTSQGGYDPAPLANKLGVPAAPLDTRGLSGKDSSMYAKQTRLAAEKKLNDPEFTGAANSARNNKMLATEFEQLMDAGQKTGGLAAVPFIGGMMKKFDPELNRMKSIQDTLTPQQREEGSGSTSNFDAEMFQSGLFGPDKPEDSNRAILLAKKAQSDDTLKYQGFLNDFLAANGHINGADTAWQSYVEANPIFDPASPSKPVLNKARKTPQEFFGGQAPQVPLGAAPQSPQGAPPANRDNIVQQLKARGRDDAYIQQFLSKNGL